MGGGIAVLGQGNNEGEGDSSESLVIWGKSGGTTGTANYGISLEYGAALWVDGQGGDSIGNVYYAANNYLALYGWGGATSKDISVSSTSSYGAYVGGSPSDPGIFVSTGASAYITADSLTSSLMDSGRQHPLRRRQRHRRLPGERLGRNRRFREFRLPRLRG